MGEIERFDLVIVGAGPGGYVAAVRAAQLGLKTACVEKEDRLGGVCLRVGCIPSKALLDSSEYYHLAKERFAEHGIQAGKVGLDLSAMMARKDKVVEELTGNVRKLLEGNKIKIFAGAAALAAKDRLEIRPAGEKKGSQTIEAGAVLLATGSEPTQVPGLEFDGKRIVSSTEALSFSSVPKKLGVVGGGYIGLELGSVWMRLGSAVSVIEMMPKVAATLDGQVGRTLQRLLKKQGMSFHLGAKVSEAKASSKSVKATVEADGKTEAFTFDRLLVAVGRRPLTRGLNLEQIGVHVKLAAPKIGVLLQKDELRKTIADIAGLLFEDEILKPVVEQAQLATDRALFAAQDHVQARADLLVQIGVPHLEGVGRQVGAVGEQFLGRGQALRAGEVDRNAPGLVSGQHQAHRGGHAVEIQVESFGLLAFVFVLFPFMVVLIFLVTVFVVFMAMSFQGGRLVGLVFEPAAEVDRQAKNRRCAGLQRLRGVGTIHRLSGQKLSTCP